MKDADFDISIPLWCPYCIVVRRLGYANDPVSYTSCSVATGRVCLAGQVKGMCQIKTDTACRSRGGNIAISPLNLPQRVLIMQPGEFHRLTIYVPH